MSVLVFIQPVIPIYVFISFIIAVPIFSSTLFFTYFDTIYGPRHTPAVPITRC